MTPWFAELEPRTPGAFPDSSVLPERAQLLSDALGPGPAGWAVELGALMAARVTAEIPELAVDVVADEVAKGCEAVALGALSLVALDDDVSFAQMPEVLAGPMEVVDPGAGVEAEVICVTSPDLLYRAIRARDGLVEGPSWILDQIFPDDRAAPMVTVLDGHPHTLAFLATINRVRCKSLGKTVFGQVGDLESVTPPRHRHRQHRRCCTGRALTQGNHNGPGIERAARLLALKFRRPRR